MVESKGYEFAIKNGKIRCLNELGEPTFSETRDGAIYHLDLYEDNTNSYGHLTVVFRGLTGMGD